MIRDSSPADRGIAMNTMKSRCRIESCASSWLGCSKPSTLPTQVDPNGPVEVVIPDHGAYTGAFMDFGDAEDDVTLETIEDFEEMVGKHQAIIVSSSYWGEQNFPTDNLNVIWRHGSLPLVFWSPWDKPYEEDHGPDKFGLTEILAGKWDAYIDKWADAARDFGHPMIVVFGVEMNGTWFPWSGAYYGGAQWVPEYNNWKGPETFRRAYRYVVDRVRARGASNIKWMFHTNNYPYPYETWNGAPAYYPGSDYVDWLGLSVYGQQYKDEPNPDIPSLVDWPYQEMSRLDPNKPIMIAEWATGEFPLTTAPPSAIRKPAWIKQGLELFRTRYPRIKAALYWHERWQNADGSYSNLRVNSSVESLRAYRSGVAHPDWLGDLILRAIPKTVELADGAAPVGRAPRRARRARASQFCSRTIDKISTWRRLESKDREKVMEPIASHENWRNCFSEVAPGLLLFARQWVQSAADAEDIVQEAFVKFWRRNHDIDNRALLYSAVRSLALDFIRRDARRARREATVFAEAEPAIEPHFELEDDTQSALAAAVESLPRDQREVLVLKIWNDLTFSEIAGALGISQNTAASRYRYALTNLKKTLQPQ